MTGFLGRIAASATAPSRLHPLLGSIFDVASRDATPVREPALAEPKEFVREPERSERVVYPPSHEPLVPARTRPEVTENSSISHIAVARDADGPQVPSIDRHVPESAVEAAAPPRTPATLASDMPMPRMDSDERVEPAVHRLASTFEFVPRPNGVEAHSFEIDQPSAVPALDARSDASVRAAPGEPVADSVQIHIGRVEVIAVAEPAQRKPARTAAPKSMSLDEYLAGRGGRAR